MVNYSYLDRGIKQEIPSVWLVSTAACRAERMEFHASKTGHCKEKLQVWKLVFMHFKSRVWDLWEYWIDKIVKKFSS